MPAADTPGPDEDRIFELLRKTGLAPEEAFTLFAGIRNMAAANLIARFESRLEALGTRFESKLDAQNAKIDSLRWVLGAGLAALGILIAALRFLG